MRSPLYRIGAFKLGYAVAQLLPRPLARRLADGVAWWSLRRSPELRRMLHDNLAVATGRSGDPLDGLVRDNLRSFARMLADYFRFAGNRATEVRDIIDPEGWEHLEAARIRGKGTILVTGHLGHWELGGLILAMLGLPMTVVTLPEPSGELTRWRGVYRRRLGIGTIAVGPGNDFAFVEMLRVLRENGCLAMLVDRPYSDTGMPVKQFGRETHFSTAAAMLAHHTGAAVIPAFVLAQPGGRCRAIACPPVEMASGKLRDTLPINVQRIADIFETLIRRHPEQWFNYVPLFSAS